MAAESLVGLGVELVQSMVDLRPQNLGQWDLQACHALEVPRGDLGEEG